MQNFGLKQNKNKYYLLIKDEYDDKMIASIELKSTDFDDENFSPVFNRKTEEYFLAPSSKCRSDIAKVNSPIFNHTCTELIDKYAILKPNHTYYRQATFDKFLAGFGLGYLLLRELPLRNFYARTFVMFVYFGKIFDHFPIFPFSGILSNLRIKC